ncbi:hypothetical protein ACWD4J_16485 [Streptomyces sp. NPDC002577]
MHSLKRTVGASALAMLGFLVTAAAPPGAAVPARNGQAALPEVSCGWPAVVRPGRLNIAFPETNATYWIMPYRLGQGESLVAQGTYPSARFMSLTSYNIKASPIDSLADHQISPSSGSKNPFAVADAGTDAAQHRFSVTLKPGAAAGSGTNTLAASTGNAASGAGFLVLRIYVPDNASDPTGGVPLPALSKQHKDGSTSTIDTCADAGSAQGPAGPLAGYLRQLVKDNAPPGGFEGCGKSSPNAPAFAVPNKATGYFPNPYNKYLCTPIGYEPGRIAVIRGKAPTFPNTSAGQSVLTETQLRYWSLCQNEWQVPYPVNSCAADYQTALDKDGRYTFVVSTPEDRPANATTDNKVTWISWGPTDVNGILLFRNMLPAADFPGAVQSVPVGGNPAATMGSYFPTITYCSKDQFAKGGPDACPTPG